MFRLKLHFTMKKTPSHPNSPSESFEKKTRQRVPKNRSKLTIEKKTTKHSQCPPPPPIPPPTCRITAKGRERHTTWLKESLSKGVEVCESRLGRLETDSRTPNFFSAICLIHTYFVWHQKASRKNRKGSNKKAVFKRNNLKRFNDSTINSPSHQVTIFPQQTPPRQVRAPAGVQYIPLNNQL